MDRNAADLEQTVRKLVAELLAVRAEVAALRAELAAAKAELAATKAEFAATKTELAATKTELAAERDRRAAAEARVHELERELARRGKDRKPSPRTPPAGANDRRKRGKRKHPGSTRPPADPAAPDADARAEDVPAPDHCLFCGGEVEDTGAFDERVIEDIPQPKREVTIYRRRVCRCNQCGRLARGRADLDVPGSRIGPRARLLAAYGRVGLGVSLGKTQQLLAEFFGLHVSRAGLLGQQEWAAAMLAPVAQRLLELLRESPVVQADETSWPQNGKYVWCWALSNPKLAVFLIERRRDRATFRRLLGDSFAGTLATDFYAVYDGLAPRQQRCLAHLAVTLRELLEKTPAKFAAPNLQPILGWVAECFAFARDRATLAPDAAEARKSELRARLAEMQRWHSTHPDCERMFKRLRKYGGQLLTFLDDPAVPPDNNRCERDARGVANDRGMGRGSRTEAGSKSYAILKSVLATARKNGQNLFAYGMSAVREALAGRPPPLPLSAG